MKSSKTKMKKSIAERGFDPRTSGCPIAVRDCEVDVWAQHASTAPLCSCAILAVLQIHKLINNFYGGNICVFS